MVSQHHGQRSSLTSGPPRPISVNLEKTLEKQKAATGTFVKDAIALVENVCGVEWGEDSVLTGNTG